MVLYDFLCFYMVLYGRYGLHFTTIYYCHFITVSLYFIGVEMENVFYSKETFLTADLDFTETELAQNHKQKYSISIARNNYSYNC